MSGEYAHALEAAYGLEALIDRLDLSTRREVESERATVFANLGRFQDAIRATHLYLAAPPGQPLR